MLRVVQQTNSAAAQSYYSKSDYLSEKQEHVGNFGGKGAERLGLSGQDGKKAFDLLCENINPQTGEPLTARTKTNRTVGYDFTWSVPKSVSLLYGLTEDKELLGAFRDSVDETMQDIEAEFKTSVRKNGATAMRTTGNGVWATFFHFTSRPIDGIPDPQMHAHCFVFNATFDEKEDRWKAGQFRDVKRDAPYFQAAFRARLAERLQEAGYQIERKKDDFEITGFSKDVLKRFSRRKEKIEKSYISILAKRMAKDGHGVIRDGKFEVDGEKLSDQQILAKAETLGIGGPELKASLGESTRELKNDTLSWRQLRDLWKSKLNDAEQAAIESVHASRSGPVVPERLEKLAVDHALDHCFVRDSVVTTRELEAEALRRGLGGVTVDGVRREFGRRKLFVREVDGKMLVTAPQVLADEEKIIAFARNGRGTGLALGGFDRKFSRDWLSEEQKVAVRHIFESPDRVILVRGAAGTGKTSMLQEAVEGLESAGHHVVALAQTAPASRGVLRTEAKIADANTIAHFLNNAELQESARNGVIIVDEVSQIGVRSMVQVVRKAEALNARLVVIGDPRQMQAVERGSVFRLLADEASLPVVELTDVRRQKDVPAYKQAVEELSNGRTGAGWDKLDRMGWICEIEDGEREKVIAADYLAAIEEKKKGGELKSAIVVAPSHAEADRITDAIRAAMKETGKLGEERQFSVWTPSHFTEAERRDAANYQDGDMLQLHQHMPGVKSGSRLIVAEDQKVPVEYAGRFQVYRPGTLTIAVGDRLLLTAGGKSRDGKRLENGDLITVKSFNSRGDIIDSKGRVIAKEFGHLARGFTVTAFASQGRTVDKVFISQSAASGRAASAETFYVSVSRGREMARVYVDQKEAVRDSILGERERLSATDLMRRPRSTMTRWQRHLGFRRRQHEFERLHQQQTPSARAQLLLKVPHKEEMTYDR